MKERFLFLEKEKKERLIQFSKGLQSLFPDSWFFYHSNTRILPPYNLNNFLEEATGFQQSRLLVNEYFPQGLRIRFLLSIGNPSAQMIMNQNKRKYEQVGNLFLKTFDYTIEKYPFQEINPNNSYKR